MLNIEKISVVNEKFNNLKFVAEKNYVTDFFIKTSWSDSLVLETVNCVKFKKKNKQTGHFYHLAASGMMIYFMIFFSYIENIHK